MKPISIHVFIDRKKFDLDDPVQTGRSLKELAGIPLGDVLFLDQPGDDLVIKNEATVTLKNGAHLHSQPAADYGDEQRYHEVSELPQPDGWTFVIYRDFQIPSDYRPDRIDVLVKLPPTFPDAAPDMFWVSPHVTVGPGGSSPRGTTTENVLSASWQRFSWHLSPGSWRPGVSTMRDFIRCIIGRFERRD
jgi:hypothetical protein